MKLDPNRDGTFLDVVDGYDVRRERGAVLSLVCLPLLAACATHPQSTATPPPRTIVVPAGWFWMGEDDDHARRLREWVGPLWPRLMHAFSDWAELRQLGLAGPIYPNSGLCPELGQERPGEKA